MARIPRTFFLLALLLSSLSCSCVMGAFDLVDKVCIQNTSPPICREALRSDVRFAVSDLTGLGYIAIDLTRRHVTATSNRIKVLIAQTQDPGLKKPLAFCEQKYREALFACERAGPSLGERYYEGFSAAGDAVSSLGKACQNAFGASPLGSINKKTVVFGDLFRSLASLLSKSQVQNMY
ncbi:hypothetical protein RHMOL_Rhmol04G0378600 [Rhododendron molle]|uniref:Uncharacterized protein n=1 Tax=Rhododendron molle TaxID=49168 RepID=A0ACC0P891_RHOML|nr:hypothetical protein RHMOL_Rhmol04G0378600 [Rhododendron molle]